MGNGDNFIKPWFNPPGWGMLLTVVSFGVSVGPLTCGFSSAVPKLIVDGKQDAVMGVREAGALEPRIPITCLK